MDRGVKFYVFLVIDQIRNVAVPTTMQERTAHDYRQVPLNEIVEKSTYRPLLILWLKI